MLYFVKYIYQTFILPPGILIILLLSVSIWLYKMKLKQAKLLFGLTAVFYLVSIPLIGDNLIRWLENKQMPPSKVEGDVIIMLGGGATLDTPNINGTGHLSGFAANRLLSCAQLYNQLKLPIIISGGQVFESTGTEAEIAKNILEQLGVPEDKITAENRSLNTTQNARYTKEIMDKYKYSKPILVTSAFHMERAVRQFKKFNLSVTPFPTDYQTNIKSGLEFRDFVPSADSLMKVNLAVKEYIGILASGWY